MSETPARLLVVDDEAPQLMALCETLGGCGYAVTGCSSGAEALAQLTAGRFDLLLTDLHMRGMDGMTLLKRALMTDPSMAAVMMTGAGTIDAAVEAMRLGAVDFVQKPFKLRTALPVLERALQITRLRLQNAQLEARVRDQRDELAQANADLEAFIASVTHDLRSPLQAVASFSDALALKHAGGLDAQGAHYVESIRASVASMEALIQGMLRLARVGRQPLHVATVELGPLVREVVEALRASGALTDDRVHVGPLPTLQGDAALLRQAFHNLLSNACKFTAKQPAPRVEVACETWDDAPVFVVRDNGAGFCMQQAHQLFQPFRRLHSAEEFAGLGIGLTIVQRIVQRHGGHIWAEAAPGKGACFRFTLPQYDGAAAAEPQQP